MQHVIKAFYKAVNNRDTDLLRSVYATDIVYFDPQFEYLEGAKVMAMWRYIFEERTSLKINPCTVKDEGDGYFTCHHADSYLFTPKQRNIEMNAVSNFRIENDRIVEHSEAFSLHQWATKAYGGWASIIGWNRWYQQQIKNSARRNLLNFL